MYPSTPPPLPPPLLPSLITSPQGWAEGNVKLDYIPGDLNFDPLGLGVEPGSFSNMSEEFKIKVG